MAMIRMVTRENDVQCGADVCYGVEQGGVGKPHDVVDAIDGIRGVSASEAA
jgi:hypothetical protein